MALTYNSINMQYAIPWNTIKAALCNMSERTFIRKSHFSCSWLLITQMISGLLFDCWLVVCSKSQVTRYDVHWNPLLACFLSPRGRWGGVEVLREAEDQSSSCRAAPQWRPSNLKGGFARLSRSQPGFTPPSIKKILLTKACILPVVNGAKDCADVIRWSSLIIWSGDVYRGARPHRPGHHHPLPVPGGAANVVLQWSSLAGLLFGELSEEQV